MCLGRAVAANSSVVSVNEKENKNQNDSFKYKN